MLTDDRPRAPLRTPADPPRMPYLSSLDGVRAISVLAVLAYHADPSWLTGGFLGVEVFFVISGYLITALLLGEHRRSGRLDLRRFWVARARRLLPALYLTLAVTAAWWVLFVPDAVGALKGQFVAALAYVSNWYLIVQQLSYFDRLGRPSPLVHLWSLAVEEQFYLVWPLILLGLLTAFRGRLKPVLYVVLGAALASALWMAWLYEPADPSRAYYGTDTRASGLLIGAALAIIWRPWQSGRTPHPRRGNLADGAGFAALGVLLVFFWLSSEKGVFLYRGGFVLVSLATALLIAACATNSNRLLRAGLGWTPLVWIGVRSYGIYLWHWPIFVLLSDGVLGGSFDGMPLQVARFAITFVVAWASFRFVESPVRHGALGRWWTAWRAGDENGQRAPLSPRGALIGTVALLAVAGLVVSVATHDVVKTELQTALEAAANDPANAAAAAATATTAPVGSVTTVLATASTISGVIDPASVTTAPSKGTGAASGLVTTGSGATTGVVATGPASAPFAVGDSVMLGAAKALHAAMPGLRIDARGSRQWSQGKDLLVGVIAAGQLGDTVVIHLGTNDGINQAGYDTMMKALAGVAKVYVVTIRVKATFQGSANQILTSNQGRYPNVHLIDWFTYSSTHPEWFYDDQTHLRPAGAAAYADLVKRTIGA